MENNYREFIKAMTALGAQPDWAGMVADVIADDVTEDDRRFDEIINARMSLVNAAIAKVQVKRAMLEDTEKNWKMGLLDKQVYEQIKKELEK